MLPFPPRRIPIRTPSGHLSSITAPHTRLSSQLSTSFSSPSPSPSSPSSSTSTTTLPTPHHDLPSFLTHATRTNLPRSSPLFIGTHYEYTAQASLTRYGLDLSRIGGRSDQGIDLIGHWHLPASILTEPLKVLVQCKALQHRRPGPHLVRELEGAFAGAPLHGYAAQGALGILCAPREATRGVREALGRSRLPLAFVMLEAHGRGRVLQFLWNRAAVDLGLDGVGVTMRYSCSAGGEDGDEGEGEGEREKEVGAEVALTWRGEVIRDLASC